MTAELGTREDQDASAEPARTAPWWIDRGPSVVAAALAVAELLWFTVELLRGYFWQDDFLYLYLGGTEPLGELLLRDHSGHLQPGAFVASWLVAHLAPLSWPAAALPAVVLHGAALLLCWLFLVRLYGERWVLLVPFVVIAFSPLTFGLSMWWAYSLQLLPMQLALFGALHAHVAYLQQPSRRRAVRGVLFIAFGMAFWEKAALIPVVLFGVTLALADGGLRARVVGTVRRYGPLLLGYLVLLAGYVALHLWRSPLPGESAPSAGDLLSMARSMIGDGLLPSLFGGPWSGDWVGLRGLGAPAPAVLAISWTLFAGVVLAGLWFGRTRAALAWLILGGYLVVTVLLLTVARFDAWGLLIGTDRRFVADAMPVAVVCAVLALLRPRGAPTGPSHVRTGGGFRGAALPLALSAAFVVGAIVSINGALPEQRHQSARDYVQNLAATNEQQQDLVLYDSHVPAHMMIGLFGEHALASRALHGLDLRFDQPTGNLRIPDTTGTPQPVGLVETVGNKPAPVPGCGYLAGPATARVQLTGTAEGSRLVVRLAYFSQSATDGIVSTPTRAFPVRFESGLHQVFVVADGPFSQLLVQSDETLCVTEVLVGKPLS